MERTKAAHSAIEMEKARVLKIDKDCFVDREWRKNYLRLTLSVCRSFGLRVDSIKRCRSRRKGEHYYVEVEPPVEPELANQLQYLLGDDASRVDFNRARIRSGLNEWNKLFEEAGRRLRTIYRSPCRDYNKRKEVRTLNE